MKDEAVNHPISTYLGTCNFFAPPPHPNQRWRARKAD